MAPIKLGIASLGLALASCSYDPPIQGDHASVAYRADLAACQEAGEKEARRRVMASGILFLTYPISLPVKVRIETRRCLEGKGYRLEG